MDTLFYVTGALVWSIIALAIAFCIAVCLYEAIGTTIFWIRVLRAGNRADIQTTFTETLRLWWSILTSYKRGTWTIKNTDEKVKWPRPWYDPKDDEEWIPG